METTKTGVKRKPNEKIAWLIIDETVERTAERGYVLAMLAPTTRLRLSSMKLAVIRDENQLNEDILGETAEALGAEFMKNFEGAPQVGDMIVYASYSDQDARVKIVATGTILEIINLQNARDLGTDATTGSARAGHIDRVDKGAYGPVAG